MGKKASISYKNLRQTIGWFGILLPLIVYLDTAIVGCCNTLQDSISHYYYTVANSFFVGILWGLGLVLLFYPSYKDEPSRDGIFTTAAGICAILVSLFPTTPHSNDSCAIFTWSESTIRAFIHYLSAAAMLSIFSYMSIRIFTKTAKGNDLKLDKNKWKRRRNSLYVISGCLTMLSISLIGLFAVLEKYTALTISSKSTFWLEVTALLPFGISWIVKGGFMLTDEGEQSTLAKAKNLIIKKQL